MRNNITVVIGLTGQTGAGKSTVAMDLAMEGCQVVDCDVVAHRVLEKNKDCINMLVEHFGDDILNAHGKIDRKILGGKVFSSRENVEAINSITHPFITQEIKDAITAAKLQGQSFVVLDAPTLIESGCNEFCDFIMAVTAPDDVRLKRIMERDEITEEAALKRINAQKPTEFYLRHCDFNIDGTMDESSRARKLKIILKVIEGTYNE